ncbi:thiol reductant ABC exporter subunit CydC [Arcanobacterium hippocoleae]|uniref:thiol reductant ABC exporter subunit CydC n=1 Tax=Arcanobacterium hippocoleae TaxID=149017 RepID=UPI00333FAD1E
MHNSLYQPEISVSDSKAHCQDSRQTKGVLPKAERDALRKCCKLLEINKKRFILATIFGSGAIGSGIGLGSVSAWLIARAAQLPPVLDLSIAATAVRAFGVGKAIFRYLERISSHWIALKGMSAIRTHAYSKLAAAPTDRVASIRRGDLLARTGADVDALGDVVVKSLLPAAVAILTSVLSVMIVATLSPLTGIILAACLLFAGILGPYLAMRGARLAEIRQVEDQAELSAQALTLLEHAQELRVSGNLAQMEAAQERTEIRILRNRDRAALPMALASSIDLLALAISVISALWIGSMEVLDGSLSAVNLVVITLTPLAAFESTQRLTGAGIQLVRSARAALRIVEMLGANFQDPAIAQREDLCDGKITPSVPLRQNAGAELAKLTLTAENLALAWPGGPQIAHGIDLELQPGKAIAIVGPSGIGKSTLLSTLAGLIAPAAGTVALNGTAVSQLAREEISQHLILTAEDAHIFETSVLENLRVVRADVTYEEAEYLLAQAGLSNWLRQLPDGLDTMLGSDAATISGGERRRLLLARALAAQASFLLLDEPGEHLDPLTADQLIRDLLQAGKTSAKSAASADHRTERGIILVTHRLNPLDVADEVILLGEKPAQIIARGTHAELIARNSIYRWSVAQEVQE